MDWKREGGRKAAAVSFSLRVLMLVLFVSPLDEKLLPFSASSICDSYSGGGKGQSLIRKRVHHAFYRPQYSKDKAQQYIYLTACGRRQFYKCVHIYTVKTFWLL